VIGADPQGVFDFERPDRKHWKDCWRFLRAACTISVHCNLPRKKFRGMAREKAGKFWCLHQTGACGKVVECHVNGGAPCAHFFACSHHGQCARIHPSFIASGTRSGHTLKGPRGNPRGRYQSFQRVHETPKREALGHKNAFHSLFHTCGNSLGFGFPITNDYRNATRTRARNTTKCLGQVSGTQQVPDQHQIPTPPGSNPPRLNRMEGETLFIQIPARSSARR